MDPSVISAGATVPGGGWRQEPSPGRWQVWPHCVAPSTASPLELETKVRNQKAPTTGVQDLLLVESNYTSTFKSKTLC